MPPRWWSHKRCLGTKDHKHTLLQHPFLGTGCPCNHRSAVAALQQVFRCKFALKASHVLNRILNRQTLMGELAESAHVQLGTQLAPIVHKVGN